MNVIPIQERARFRVESESGDDPYLVDLLEYRRNGKCDCKNFAIEIEPLLADGKIPDRRWCKHCAAVRDYLGRLVAAVSGIVDLTHDELAKAVDRIVFRWAREETNAQLHPRRYGTR